MMPPAIDALVESCADAIIGVDTDNVVQTWNHGAREILGYTAEEAIGRSIVDLISTERRDEFQALIEDAKAGHPARHSGSVAIAKGDFAVEVAVTVSPIFDPSGSVTGISVIARDVTEQRGIAATLEETMAKLEGALGSAQDTEARTRRFLADAAHQLRSPIASIRANAETILGGVDDDDRDRLLRNLVREVARGDRLVRSLLLMARLDEGEPVVPGPYSDIVGLCCDEADRTWSLAPNLDIVVKADQLPVEPLHVDAAVVREILANLLDNARRHAGEGIQVLVKVVDGSLEIRVVDDGPGLAPDVADRAFDRFASLDGKGGSGLGLPIARELARAHRGELDYAGRNGGFVLRIPVGASWD